MSNPAIKSIIKKITTIALILLINHLLFAQEPRQDTINRNNGYIESKNIPETKKGTVFSQEGGIAIALQQPEEKNLSDLQKQARIYRNQGLQLQRIGGLDEAMAYYQKAIELDPAYAVAYNDLGIVYESKGFIDRAEESYLKAVKIDTNYLSAYSNLALLYENKRDLQRAAFYWRKRAQLGSSDDPWTEKARQRLEDILLVLGERGIAFKEQEVIGLTKEVITSKSILKGSNKEFAKYYLEKAKLSYQKGDQILAFKDAINAQQLDPANSEINEFVERIQTRLLSR